MDIQTVPARVSLCRSSIVIRTYIFWDRTQVIVRVGSNPPNVKPVKPLMFRLRPPLNTLRMTIWFRGVSGVVWPDCSLFNYLCLIECAITARSFTVITMRTSTYISQPCFRGFTGFLPFLSACESFDER